MYKSTRKLLFYLVRMTAKKDNGVQKDEEFTDGNLIILRFIIYKLK